MAWMIPEASYSQSQVMRRHLRKKVFTFSIEARNLIEDSYWNLLALSTRFGIHGFQKDASEELVDESKMRVKRSDCVLDIVCSA